MNSRGLGDEAKLASALEKLIDAAERVSDAAFVCEPGDWVRLRNAIAEAREALK